LRSEPITTDACPTRSAHAVLIACEPGTSLVELDALGAGTFEEGAELGAFEPDRRTFGIMLIVQIGERRRLDDLVEGALQLAFAGDDTRVGLLEERRVISACHPFGRLHRGRTTRDARAATAVRDTRAVG
jgi:hypothetical protein